jgi:hypothetical protein
MPWKMECGGDRSKGAPGFGEEGRRRKEWTWEHGEREKVF